MFGNDDHNDNDKPQDEGQQTDQAADDVIKPDSETNTDDNWQHPGPPPDDVDKPGPSDDSPTAPAVESPEPAPEPSPQPTVDSTGDNGLIDLKQQALTELSPIVDHLDQAPDEKFHTLMMMIQASDNQSLVKQAYETALKIDDEKERAQALLDIVNEINYFTQNSAKPE